MAPIKLSTAARLIFPPYLSAADPISRPYEGLRRIGLSTERLQHCNRFSDILNETSVLIKDGLCNGCGYV
jgi:hypothetical protein